VKNRNSSVASGSSHQPVVNAGGADAAKKVEAAVAQLHLAELKAILLRKEKFLAKSPLAGSFSDKKKNDDQLLEAKTRMRGLLGRSMFYELEMQQPQLLRIGMDDGHLCRYSAADKTVSLAADKTVALAADISVFTNLPSCSCGYF
jgi:hypothetical protein